ncbi:MAG TPA: hypothetical protein VGC86_13620 [Afipia sp.]
MTKFLMIAAMAAVSGAALSAREAKAGPVCISDITPPGMYRSCEYLSFKECRRNAAHGGGVCARHRYVDDGGYLNTPTFGPMVLYDQRYYAGPVYSPVYSAAPVRALY